MPIQILIPAYQPDDRLAALVEELRMIFPVTVVDDGSGKEYSSIFFYLEELGATVLHHEANYGKGAALKTGIRHTMEQGDADGIVTADADGQHTISDITKIALILKEHPGTFIIGGRDFTQMPPRSRFGNTLTRFFFRLCTGLKISDTQTGLRGLPACLFEKLAAIPGDRYEYEMDVLLSLKDWGTPYLEVPIDTVYLDGNRSTHFHAVRDGLRVFSRVIKYAVSSLACTAVDYLLYLLFLSFLSVGWSYAAARVFSAALNYFLNCRLVFQGKPTLTSFLGYALLAVFSLATGSLATSCLVSLGVSSVLAKLLIDGCLFAINYIVQKKLVFRRPKASDA